jgi:hypothetical protein
MPSAKGSVRVTVRLVIRAAAGSASAAQAIHVMAMATAFRVIGGSPVTCVLASGDDRAAGGTRQARRRL